MAVGQSNTERLINILPSAATVGVIGSKYVTLTDSVADPITATPSGTQTTSLLLTAKANNITVVATAADGVRLPPATAGAVIKVRNGATNSAAVFPSSAAQGGISGGDSINALAANGAYTLATGTVTFTCYTAGKWFTA